MADPQNIPFEAPQVVDTITVGAPIPVVDPETMGRRAIHYHQSLGARSPGPDAIYNRLVNNQEPELRRELAITEQTELFNRRNEFMRQYIQNRPADAGPPSQAEREYVQRMSSGELAEAQVGDPRVYIERKLAEQATAAVAPTRANVPENIATTVDRSIQTEQMLVDYAKTKLQDLLSEQKQLGVEDTPYLGRNALNNVGLLASPVWWYRMNARLPSDGSFWSGNNIASQASWYYSQRNISAATSALDTAIENLRSRNPQNPDGNLSAAIQYLSLIVSNSTFDYTLQNFQSYADVAPFVGWVPYGITGRLAYQGLRSVTTGSATRTYAAAATQVARAAVVNPPETAPAAMAEAAGNFRAAADYTARNQLQDLAERTHGPEGLNWFTGYSRSIFFPDSVISEAGTRLSNEAAQRVATSMNETAESLVNLLTLRPTQIPRLTPGSAPAMAAQDAAERIAKHYQYDYASDRILDSRIIFPTDYSQLPPRLRAPAQTVVELEKDITRFGLVDAFEDYKTLKQSLADLTGLLSPFTKRYDRVSNKLAEAMQRAGVDAKDIVANRRAIAAEIKKIPAKDLKLFETTIKADVKYNNARTIVPTRIPRPNGLEPVVVPANLEIVHGIGNVPHIIIPIGNREAELFDTIERAQLSAMRELHLRPGTYRISQQGNGYYISVLKPLDETLPSVRSALELDLDKTPRPGLPVDWFQRIFGGSTRVSATQSKELKTAVYGTSGMLNEVSKLVRNTVVDPIKGGGKESVQAFNKFAEYQRVLRDPGTKIRGMFSQNQMEFETQWFGVIGRYPTEKESIAYWTYVQVNNIDKLLRDLSVYRDKARAGLEINDLLLTNSGIRLEGKVLADVPWEDARHERAGFLIWDQDESRMSHVYANSKNGQKTVQDFQNKGYKVLQITHFAEKDLQENAITKGVLNRLGQEYQHSGYPSVDFILTREMRSSPLPLQQTPNRAGGHHQYAFTSLLRQPDIRNGKYYGDNTLRGFEYSEDAKFFLPRYEEARRIMNDIDSSGGRIPESTLENYLKKNLPESVDEFRRLFTTGPYNRNLPFMITADGVNTWKQHKLQDTYRGLVNALDSRLNLYNSSTLKYMMERGETPLTVAKRGTTENPSYSLKPAKMLDALPTMDRAIHHAVRNTSVSDVQIKSAENFIAEFHDVLAKPLADLRRDPMDAVLNPVYRPDADRYLLQTAKNYQRVLIESLGLKTPEAQGWEATVQSMMNQLYRLGGETAVSIASPSMIKTIKDPPQAIRAATSYYYLMSPWQFFVQAAGAMNIAAIGGWRVASEALPAAIYGRIIRDFTGVKGMLDHAAEKMLLWGWTREQFKEAYEAGRATGFFNVGREHSLVDDLTQPRVSRSLTGAILDFGMTPFRKGEETVRHMSWWASYKMWRDKNPDTPLDDISKMAILSQADRMTGNMSSVGMSSIQRSILGVPMTFWGYNMRMFEQLTGLDQQKLTGWQRTKTALNWMFVYSALVGIPAAAGTAVFFPVSNLLNRWLIDARIKEAEDRGVLESVLAGAEENLNPVLFDLITKGVLGTFVAPGTNVSERYAPGYNRFFSDMLGDKTMFEIMGGATYSAVRDVFLSIQPFITFVYDSLRPAQEATGARISQEDIERVIANVGGRGASAVMRSYWALALQDLMSNQRFSLTKLTTSEAIVFTLTGLQPNRVADAFDILKNEKSLREHQNYHERYIIQAFRDMMRASEEGRFDDAFRYSADMRVHITLGHFRPDQIASLVPRLSRDKGEIVENVFRQYAQRGPRQAEFYLQYLKQLER